MPSKDTSKPEDILKSRRKKCIYLFEVDTHWKQHRSSSRATRKSVYLGIEWSLSNRPACKDRKVGDQLLRTPIKPPTFVSDEKFFSKDSNVPKGASENR